jgi:DNA mismatch repair ATPase MutL
MSSGLKNHRPIKFLNVADREKMLADVVIIDLRSIIEELVLNAIDAGAKRVKIW